MRQILRELRQDEPFLLEFSQERPEKKTLQRWRTPAISETKLRTLARFLQTYLFRGMHVKSWNYCLLITQATTGQQKFERIILRIRFFLELAGHGAAVL